MNERTLLVELPASDFPMTVARTQAAKDVLAERQRQIEREGWTPEHDDEHDDFELSAASASYAWAAGCNAEPYPIEHYRDAPPKMWPWDDADWKPGDVRRMLVKAGALILAEIERLDRATVADGVDSSRAPADPLRNEGGA